MPAETTNPRITLADVMVSEKTCQARTDKIMASQSVLLDEIRQVKRKVIAHRAWHNGKEHAQQGTLSRGQFWMRAIGLVLVLVALVGGTVWAVSRAIPDATEIAKALKEAQP